jgi:S-adenosylmethionine synthetase
LKPICGILSAIHEQSADINQGVDRANPEDQGALKDVWLL